MTWLSLIGCGLKNWKYIVSSAVALAVGLGIAWYIQGIRVEYAKSQISNLKLQIADCQAANKTNQETITSLESEVFKSQSLCNSRLGVKDKVIKRLREIDGLRAIVLQSDSATVGEKNIEKNSNAVDDPLLDELNRMFIKADSKD